MTAATSQKASFRPRRPKDEIESMLAAHMALTNIALLDSFASIVVPSQTIDTRVTASNGWTCLAT
jgi:hypothetical protein